MANKDLFSKSLAVVNQSDSSHAKGYQNTFDVNNGDAQAGIDAFMGSMNRLATAIGAPLLDPISSVADYLTKGANAAAAFAEESPKVTATIIAVTSLGVAVKTVIGIMKLFSKARSIKAAVVNVYGGAGGAGGGSDDLNLDKKGKGKGNGSGSGKGNGSGSGKGSGKISKAGRFGKLAKFGNMARMVNPVSLGMTALASVAPYSAENSPHNAKDKDLELKALTAMYQGNIPAVDETLKTSDAMQAEANKKTFDFNVTVKGDNLSDTAAVEMKTTLEAAARMAVAGDDREGY